MAAEQERPLHPRLEPPIVPLRSAKLAPNDSNLAVEPNDPIDESWQRWFRDPSRVREGNEVIPYLDAAKLFADMASAIRTATSAGHAILFAGWSVDIDLPLLPGDPTSTLLALFTAAGASGAQVFVLLNRFSAKAGGLAAFDNTDDVARLDALPGVHAIHDDLLLAVPLLGDPVQAHHQKLLVVSGEQGLVAFLGGVDVEPNRLDFLQDLHVRVRGAAAQDHHRTLVERWLEHGRSPVPPPPSPSQNLGDKCDLRVATVRTYPNAPAHGGLRRQPSRTYAFAPSGEQSYRQQVLHAIAQAKRHIYVEDQYLVDAEIAQAIAAVAPRLELVLLLVCADEYVGGELAGQMAWRRHEFLRIARSTQGRVLCYENTTYFVHPKVWLFDDRFAIVGSGNVNRRGLTHDSEVACAIYDDNLQRRWFFAHELRMRLWARQTWAPPIQHREAFGSVAYRFHAESQGRVRTCVPAAPGTGAKSRQPWAPPSPPTDPEQFVWDSLIDPDGS